MLNPYQRSNTRSRALRVGGRELRAPTARGERVGAAQLEPGSTATSADRAGDQLRGPVGPVLAVPPRRRCGQGLLGRVVPGQSAQRRGGWGGVVRGVGRPEVRVSTAQRGEAQSEVGDVGRSARGDRQAAPGEALPDRHDRARPHGAAPHRLDAQLRAGAGVGVEPHLRGDDDVRAQRSRMTCSARRRGPQPPHRADRPRTAASWGSWGRRRRRTRRRRAQPATCW